MKNLTLKFRDLIDLRDVLQNPVELVLADENIPYEELKNLEPKESIAIRIPLFNKLKLISKFDFGDDIEYGYDNFLNNLSYNVQFTDDEYSMIQCYGEILLDKNF